MDSGRYVEAREDLNRALELNPSSHVDRYNLIILNAIEGKHDDLLDEVNAFVTDTPDRVLPLLCRVEIQLFMNNYTAAEVDIDAAKNIAPKEATVLFLQGHFYFIQQEYAQAHESYQAALKLNPYSAMVMGGVAIAYLKLENHDEAIRMWKQAIVYDRRYTNIEWLTNANSLFPTIAEASVELAQLVEKQ